MNEKYNPCENCLTFVICKNRIYDMANKVDFSKGTPREEMIRCVMLSALKDHCSIISDMAKVPFGLQNHKSPKPNAHLATFQYDSRKIAHIAKTFGETI